MARVARIEPRRYRAITRNDIDRLAQLRALHPDDVLAMKAVAAVLPFRVNEYVVDELIDWTDLPGDPVFQLTFPQEGMAYVDFDGARALAGAETVPADAPLDEDFLRTYCGQVLTAMDRVVSWLTAESASPRPAGPTAS